MVAVVAVAAIVGCGGRRPDIPQGSAFHQPVPLPPDGRRR
jgi:hypothetical protein